MLAFLTRSRALGRWLLAALVMAALPAFGAPWPERPVHLVVPFPAGGTVDLVARLLADQLGRQLGTQVVVENVPGAGGVVAGTRVVKSAPDGYTLLFATPNHTINPSIIRSMPYDTEKDLVPVSVVAQIPELLVAHSAQPYDDFKGFVAYARAHPGQLAYGSAGNGTLPHVSTELMLQQLDLSVLHVPYKGAAPALNDLLSGQIALKMDTIATASQHVRSGKLKALAIASLERSPLMPEVPTVAESGLPGYEGLLWMGMLAPAGTPADVIDRLQREVAAAGQQAAYRKSMADAGVDVLAVGPTAFAQRIRTELKQWAEVVKRSGIKAQ